MPFGLFGNKGKKIERKAAAEQANRDFAEKENKFQKEYARICASVQEALLAAKKPRNCNAVISITGEEFFPGLKNYQWNCKEWEIWRTGDLLYLYSPAVDGYPDYEEFGLYIGDPAPMLLSISISDIQYFKMDGDTYHETKITGGQVTQNRRTGRVSQMPLQSKTVNRDTRHVCVTTRKDGVIQRMDFQQDAYDILFSLIPEKEYSRVVKGD